jgi:hypothetical protein
MRNGVPTLLALAVVAGTLLSPVPVHTAGDNAAAAPFWVTIPKGYRDWQMVAPSQRDDKDEIRMILGNDIAMKAYREKTLPFPDGAILAKLAWKRIPSGEFANTFVPGEPQRIEFMVKNAKQYASTGGWGFGRFVDGKPASEADHATCFPCHEANVKGHDFVFTRYAQ